MLSKSFKETCIDFLKDENTRKNVKDMLIPIANILYNELYIYILLICIYNICVFLIILAILILLLRNTQKNELLLYSV